MHYCTTLFLYRSWAPSFARFACRPKLDLRPAVAPAFVLCYLRLRRAAFPRFMRATVEAHFTKQARLEEEARLAEQAA